MHRGAPVSIPSWPAHGQAGGERRREREGRGGEWGDGGRGWGQAPRCPDFPRGAPGFPEVPRSGPCLPPGLLTASFRAELTRDGERLHHHTPATMLPWPLLLGGYPDVAGHHRELAPAVFEDFPVLKPKVGRPRLASSLTPPAPRTPPATPPCSTSGLSSFSLGTATYFIGQKRTLLLRALPCMSRTSDACLLLPRCGPLMS